MDDFNTSTRLRNACDACHKLKRKCTGAMPCENCALYGSSCFYSVAGRLGRPRGSRSRRNADGTPKSTPQAQKARQSGHQDQPQSPPGSSGASATAAAVSMSEDWAQQHPGRLGYIAFPAASSVDSDMADIVDPPSRNETESGFHNPRGNDVANAAFNNMLDSMDFDGFDPTSFYNKLSMNSAHGSDAALNLFSASDADPLQALDHSPTLDSSSLSQPTTGNNTPLSISPMQVNFGQQQQQDHPVRQQPETQLRAPLYKQHQHPQQQSQSQPHSRQSPPPSCQCIPGLSSLLHDLKRATDDKIPPAGLDDVLSRVSEALTQWSALAACPRCQHHDGEDDEGETLLLAALSMRRVVAQLRAVGCRPGVKGFGEDTAADGGGEDDAGPQLHVGAYQVTGSDRTMLLSVLRTITVRKLDAAVTTLRSMLRTKQARHSGSDSATLLHIEAMLDELAKAIKRLQ